MNFIGDFCGGLLSIVKFTTVTILVSVGSLSIFAYYTKPTNESLKKYFDEKTKRQINGSTKDDLIGNLIYKGLAKLGSKTIVDTEIDDYIVFKIGKVLISGSERNYNYIGIAGNWIPLDN